MPDALLCAASKADFKPARSALGVHRVNISLGQRPEMGVPLNSGICFRGANMTERMFAIVPAMVLALGAAMVQAQPGANPYGQFHQAGGAAHATWFGNVDPDGTAGLSDFTGQGDFGEGWIGNSDGEGGPSNVARP